MDPVASTASDELFLDYALRMTRNRIRMIDLFRALLLMTAAAFGMILIMIVLDHGLDGGLPTTGMWVGHAVLWAMVAGIGTPAPKSAWRRSRCR